MRRIAACVVAAFVSACADGLPPIRFQIGEGTLPPAPQFQGVLAGDEPEAVLAASQVLRARGNAADAATVLGLALAVTLPSRAGLGGSGACLVRDAKSRKVEAIDFRAVGGYARGFAALHARYGALPWGQVVAPAENMARFGVVVSRALANDMAKHGATLIGDRGAFTVFTTLQRQLLREGDRLTQADLAESFARLRVGGAEGPVPEWRAATAFQAPGTDGATFLALGEPGVGTSFSVVDPEGGVVSCALSMGSAFGTGVLAGGRLGGQAPPYLSATILFDRDTAEPRASFAGVGTRDRVTRAAKSVLPPRGVLRIDGADEGRVSGWSCVHDIKLDGARCQPVADPAGAGYALALVPPPG